MSTEQFGDYKMRVLQVNSVCGIGSTGRIATDLHEILQKHGNESYIAFGRNEAMNCETSIRIGTKYDQYYHVFLTRIFDRHGQGSKSATKHFIHEIIQLQPDIIHLQNIHGYYIHYIELFQFLREYGKPVIWTLHDCWAFTGHCAHFEYVGCLKWETHCHKCPQKAEYPKSILFDNSKNNFDIKRDSFCKLDNLTIVTPSDWLSRLVRKSFLNDYRVVVINNGIDLDVFRPCKSNFRERNNIVNKYILLGVTNIWDEKKGFKYFLDLSIQLTLDEVIVLVGVTESQKRNLPINIIGITKTNNIIELAEIYSTSDIFVNPTLQDNFPTTNIESLACGTPIVTFHTGGSIESVSEDCGLIAKKGDLQDLILKIRVIKDNGKSSYSKQCIERAKKLYDKNERYLDYITLYEEVLK